MASILKVDEMQGVTSAGDITITSEGGAATQSLQQGLIKCWIQHDAGQTVTDSLNVSSISDDGTGDYSSTFSNNMSNAGYAIAGSWTDNGTGVCCPDAVSTSVINATYKTLASGASGGDGDVTMMAAGDLA